MSTPSDHRSGGSPIRAGRAVLLVAVAVVCAVLLLGRLGHGTTSVAAVPPTTSAPTTSVPQHSTTTAPPASTPPPVAASQVKVQVLNGVLSGLYSSEWSDKLHSSFGYITEPPLDATAAVTSSSIYVLTSGYLPEADRLASQVGLPAADIVASVPPPADAPIPASVLSAQPDLVLVVGPDLTSKA